MKYVFFLFIICFFSCGNEKSIKLPEVNETDIHDVKDVSPAYIFYNENKKDSVELNRKNLIISTNWLVNVDKRLTLKQVIPSIITLQDKKRNAKMHKNEKARNYFTCNDLSIKNLGFIDFTDVIFHLGIDENIIENQLIYDNLPTGQSNHIISILIRKNDSITVNSKPTNKLELTKRLKYMDSIQNKMIGVVYLKFSENLTFQDYITYKSLLSKVKLKHTIVSSDEYIFD